jgi:hypothetical protein
MSRRWRPWRASGASSTRGTSRSSGGRPPPVYDLGGLSCDIDDFVVTPAANWTTTGVRLLRAALAEAGQRGAVQAVVVTTHLDEPKREALRACGREVASEWWVTPQGLQGG